MQSSISYSTKKCCLPSLPVSTSMERTGSDHFIKSMLRSQLIVEQNGVLEINRYFMPYLIKEFETEIGDEPWEENADVEVISTKKKAVVIKKDHSTVSSKSLFFRRE